MLFERISSFIFPANTMVAGDSFRWAAGESDLTAADNAMLVAIPMTSERTRLFQITWTHDPSAIAERHICQDFLPAAAQAPLQTDTFLICTGG